MRDDTTMYERIRALFDEKGVAYREVLHEPEGRCEEVSRLRGNEVGQAAKAMVVMVKLGKKARRYILAVVPGDRRIDLDAVRRLCGGTHAMFAPSDRATELSGCPMGAVPPISFSPELGLVVDPMLLARTEIVFNSGRLDASMFVSSDAYLAAVKPNVASIAT